MKKKILVTLATFRVATHSLICWIYYLNPFLLSTCCSGFFKTPLAIFNPSFKKFNSISLGSKNSALRSNMLGVARPVLSPFFKMARGAFSRTHRLTLYLAPERDGGVSLIFSILIGFSQKPVFLKIRLEGYLSKERRLFHEKDKSCYFVRFKDHKFNLEGTF